MSYSPPEPPDVDAIEVDVGAAFEAGRSVVDCFVPHATTSQMGMTAIAMLACGAMIATAIYQLDATLRRRLP